ncbi:Heavy metal transport/detoxification protein [Gordonia bronchialis DSM 43247]|uniref:Heavy metal transport/detoxification protein n=1 Tax=Gordonia bronchialis (strain ATCC 25592 / DSM 43247 / BCRC 13721 / JCM 3198 / KCTC 3076 / NBRC 16047 / NCTC 10667) TaxID=526226 RepID=D0L792_GORB4|nr:heavy metal-associated domain-containing protein [Gordonia bronchialis]ACY23681.1 Heavy metal transport/detoxification protein [Gordonia bronchialis DSM 43247]MCC3321847.1 heavy-metal-associated domain-containing protein [Gordonia bronchialis]QGS22991.1 copper ion binding protein [Gordonia bronchialis]UAK36718.1 heavy-metal-associated domain-containing protein [Gordonia bronchialis]STQ66691.1 Copper chaperone CopZ [Gordonia bronchialis]
MATQTTTDYTVTGMTCGHCVASVREEIGEIPGVTGVDVTLDTGAVRVTSDREIDRSQIAAAVAEAGYQLT